VPLEEDWTKVLAYGERVRRITYEEANNNVSSSIFPIIEEYRPRTYILPHLHQLTWKAETPAGLDRAQIFLNPELQGLILEVGTKFPQLNSFLTDMCSRTNLTTFSFTSPTPLSGAFTELLLPQAALEKVTLAAPGALSPDVGRWLASLPKLKNLRLDLSGRSVIAVEGFFDDIGPRSGDSTPSSVGSTDSGVFSGEEADISFSEIRKSALRLTGDLGSKGSFAQMRHLHLTGEASNIAVFLRHLTARVTQLELVIEDPPDNGDWQDLSTTISERFGGSLQSLRITATGSSRFADLVRSTARAEPPSNHLPLQYLASLPQISRLEIDLPESVIFHDSDISHLASACPNLEVLRLCPIARYPVTSAPPKLTLEALAPLTNACRRLHTIALVINAQAGSAEVLRSLSNSSYALQRLHVGHSWVNDPLQVAILLSHLAPRLETLKWFHEKNRPGFVETNAQGWQKVSDDLPHLQKLRLWERSASASTEIAYAPPKFDKTVDATVKTVDQGVMFRPPTGECAIQVSPSLVSRMVEARPTSLSMAIDATPSVSEMGVFASPSRTDQSVGAAPSLVSTAVDASVLTGDKSTETAVGEKRTGMLPTYFVFPMVYGLLSLAYRIFVSYPLYFPLRIVSLLLGSLHARRKEVNLGTVGSEKHVSDSSSSSPSLDLDISPVRE
jgi:hypothetical protein